jgi:hypothetical protein
MLRHGGSGDGCLACRFASWLNALPETGKRTSALPSRRQASSGTPETAISTLVHGQSKQPKEMAEAERLNERLVHRASHSDGTCTGEHGIGCVQDRLLPAEHGEAGECHALSSHGVIPTTDHELRAKSSGSGFYGRKPKSLRDGGGRELCGHNDI